MNKEYIDGFVKTAQKAGLSQQAIFRLLKQAGGDPGAGMPPMDPSGGMGGPPPGAGMPPMDPSGGMGGPPPGAGAPPDVSQGTGVPPEIEQLIQQLPPEVLQQLLQEIQAELAGGAGGPPPDAGGPPPGMGEDPSAMASSGDAPPMDPSALMAPKQGSLLARHPAYQESFLNRGREYNLDDSTIVDLYKKAVAYMDSNPTVVYDSQEKEAAYFEGFADRAKAFGISYNDAREIYARKNKSTN